MDKKKILYVTSELAPYYNEGKIANSSFEAARNMIDAGNDVRVFMPKFGIINERRHQLHEVIRLSGMNIVVNDIDQPLIIKVASIPGAKLQTYFIDNEDYFSKNELFEEDGSISNDMDERMQFFARGVFETIKKLNWNPDVIHIKGWFGALLPVYLKTVFKNEPLFNGTKIVYTIFNDSFDGKLNENLIKNLKKDGVDAKYLKEISDTDGYNIQKIAILHADGVVFGEEFIDEKLLKLITSEKKLSYKELEKDTKEAILSFYTNQIMS